MMHPSSCCINEMTRTIELISAENAKIQAFLRCSSDSVLAQIIAAAEKREKLEAELVSVDEAISLQNDRLQNLEAMIAAKRKQISRILSNPRNTSSKTQTTLSQLKAECVDMELRIRLGLHELNQYSHSPN